MEPADIYRFDLQGFIKIPAVLSPAEVASANGAIDRHQQEVSQGFQSSQAMLGWPDERDRAPFQRMLAHPRLVPYLNTLCGRGYRMDHVSDAYPAAAAAAADCCCCCCCWQCWLRAVNELATTCGVPR
jgi:hypothetical protein